MADRLPRPARMLSVFVRSLLIAAAIVMLGKYFGWPIGPPSLY